jgi:hypothetical protein
MTMINPLLQLFVSAAFLVAAAIGSAAAGQAPSPTAASKAQRAPGLHRQPLALPVPRTFDLKHVEAAVYAKALGNDPLRIFEFVRDQIAYESYDGCLRGARGTLLAMAGNSVDRAVLLASMLQASGQHTRYAHGKISESIVRELVFGMWAQPPDDSQGRDDDSTKSENAFAFIAPSIERDLKTITDLIPKPSSLAAGAVSLQTLLQETAAHYWTQWEQDGKWIDLDPSFADSLPGKSLVAAENTYDSIPDALFHRVTIRVRLEECQGTKATIREVLKTTVKAADLAAEDRILGHWPENWKGPSNDLGHAISSAVDKTGRIKPVLFTGANFLAGQTFQQKPTAAGGLGGMGAMLRGEGTRKAPILATAEYVDFVFKSPNGDEQIVTREILDVIGPARRLAKEELTAADVERFVNATDAHDLTSALFSFYFSPGRIDPVHFADFKPDGDKDSENVRLNEVLRNIGTAVTVGVDALLPRAGSRDGASVLFYPDSPRVVVVGLSPRDDSLNVSLDLRRTHVRAVTRTPESDNIFDRRILRGVAEGTVERAVMRLITGVEKNEARTATTSMSTSDLFERAQKKGTKPIFFHNSADVHKNAEIPADAFARLAKDLADGFVTVAPERSVEMDGRQRFAWWRVEKNSGETIAVSDEGLYAVEYKVTVTKNSVEDVATVEMVTIEDGVAGAPARYPPIRMSSKGYVQFIKDMLRLGAKMSYRPL